MDTSKAARALRARLEILSTETDDEPRIHINGIVWQRTNEAKAQAMALEHIIGFIPTFVHARSDGRAHEQIEAFYQSGWRPIKGFTLTHDTLRLKYSGDPDLRPLAWAILPNNEAIIVYGHAFTAIVQPSLTFDVARLD